MYALARAAGGGTPPIHENDWGSSMIYEPRYERVARDYRSHGAGCDANHEADGDYTQTATASSISLRQLSVTRIGPSLSKATNPPCGRRQIRDKDFPVRFPDASSIKLVRCAQVSCNASGCAVELPPIEMVHRQL